MFNLVTTLVGGVLLIVLLFWLLHRFSRMNGKAVAVWLALAVLGTYVPYSILFWPGADVFAIHLAVYMVSVYVLAIIASQREQEQGRGWHWGPAAIAVFFMIVVSVDAVFIMLAQQGVDSDIATGWLPEPEGGGKVSSFFPGVVSHDFQQKEDEYNAYRRRVVAQKRLGWQVSKGWLNKPVVNQPATFKVSLRDRDNQLIAGADVRVDFLRPSDSSQDQLLHLQEQSTGEYVGQLQLPLPGRWDVVLKIKRQEDRYELRGNTTVSAE